MNLPPRKFRNSNQSRSKISEIIENWIFGLGLIVLIYATVKILYRLIFI